MFLTQMVAYADKHSLLSAYRKRGFSHRLQIDKDGSLALLTAEEEIDVPYLRDRKTGKSIDPYPLFDRVDYVLDVPSAGKSRRDGLCREFWKLARTIAEKAGDKEVIEALEHVSEGALKSFAKKVDPDTWVILTLGDQPLAHRPKIRAYFEKEFLESLDPADGPDVCLVSGRPCHAVRTHERVAGVPGTGGGVPLISFKSSTSCDNEQLDQGLNFPTSQRVGKSAAVGLRHILTNSSARIGDDKSFGTCFVCWGPEEAPMIPKVVHPYDSPEDRATSWQAIERLRGSDELLHIAFLKGSQGRMAIMSYDILRAGDVAESLLRFRATFAMPLGVEDNPSLIGALSRTAPKDFPIIDTMTTIETVRAILLGRGVPKTLRMKIAQHIEPKGKDTDYHRNVRLKWFEYWKHLETGSPLKLKINTYGERDMYSSEPDFSTFVESQAANPFYHVGSLVAVVDRIRARYHAPRRVPSNAAENRRRVMLNPAAGIDKLVNEIGIYREKLHGKDRWLLLASELLVKIPSNVGIKPLTADDRCNLSLGYSHMDAYAWATLGYYSDLKKRDKAAE